MGVQSRSKRRSDTGTGLPLRSKELLTSSAPLSSSKKRLGGELEGQRASKKFHLIDAAESKDTTGPSAVHSKDDVAAQATVNGGHVLPQSAQVEFPVRLPLLASSLVKDKELSSAVALKPELKPAAPFVKQPEFAHEEIEVAKIISEFETVEDLEELRGFSLADLAELYGMSAEDQDDLREEDFQGDAAKYFYGPGGLNKKGKEGVDSDSEDDEDSDGEGEYDDEGYDYSYDDDDDGYGYGYNYGYSGADDDFESSTFICEDASEDEYSEGECEADSDDEVENDEDADEDADDEEPEMDRE